MSVASTTPVVVETGNGVKYAFDFAFKIVANTDLVVRRKTAAGVVSAVLTMGVDYTVTFDSAAETGTVTYIQEDLPDNPGTYVNYPIESGGSSIIERAMPLTQPTVYPREGKLPAKTQEGAHDRQTLQIQDLDRRLDRAVVQENSYDPETIGLAAPVDGKALLFTDNGDGTWTVEPSTDDFNDIVTDATAAQVAAEAAQAGAEVAQTGAEAAQTAAEAAQTAAEAAQVAAEAAQAAIEAQSQEGIAADRPAAPATRVEYYATDTGELSIWRPTAGRWFTIG